MFRELRKFKQKLSNDEIIEILTRNINGVLACLGDEGYPYAVALSYVYHNHMIYFHSASDGHKIDAIRQHEKVSFVVIDEDRVMPELYTTFFRSAHLFGKARLINSNEPEWFDGFKALNDKYCYVLPEQKIIDKIKSAPFTTMIAIDIEHMSGKEAKEYAMIHKPENYSQKKESLE